MTQPKQPHQPQPSPQKKRLEYVKPRLQSHPNWIPMTGLTTPVGP